MLLIAAALQLTWGLVPSASKVVIDEIPIELYISLRWTISAVVFAVLLYGRHRWRPQWNGPTLAVALLGIAAYGLGSLGTLYGLKAGGVANFALMSSLSPVITSVVSILVLKERPRKVFYFALPICVSGLLLLVIGKHAISSWDVALTSAVLIVGAALLEALIFVFSKRLKSHFSSLQYLAISQAAAALFFWALQGAYFHQWGALTQLSPAGWSAAIFVSVVACVLCYSILYWLLNYIDGHRLALFDGLHALSATAAGILFFHETVNVPMAMGGLLLISGLVLGSVR